MERTRLTYEDQTKVQRHRQVCERMNALYERKNKDYGDSFHNTFVQQGMAMARIRLSDKLNRFKQLTRNKAFVQDESIVDTLIDMANYCVMTILEIEEMDDDVD